MLFHKETMTNIFNRMLECTKNIKLRNLAVPKIFSNIINSCVENVKSGKIFIFGLDFEELLKITERDAESDKENDNKAAKIRTYVSKIKDISETVNDEFLLKLEEVSEDVIRISNE